MCIWMCCGMCNRKIWTYGTVIIVMTLGISLAIFWPSLSLRLVHKNLEIKPGTEGYMNFMEAPVPIFLTISLFHWDNPEQVRDFNVKPKFKEMGPYVFTENHIKGKVEFYNNDTVSFFEKRTWHFDKSRSGGNLDDMITSAHIPSTVVAESTNMPFLRKIGNIILNREGGRLTVTKSAIEWIFDGFDDKLLNFLVHFNSTKIPVPFKKFGWLVNRNNSLEYDGRFTLGTGVDDERQLGKIFAWNGSPRTSYYKGECSNVNGTLGSLFPPNIDTNKPLTLFATDACRFLNLIPNKRIKHLGLDGVSFLGEARSIGGAEYPEQQCFCPTTGECPKSGVVQVKKCRDNAPIYTSYPHFYLADKSYINAVEGMKPEKEKHQFEVALEPFTGIPLKINGRLQINMLMKPYKGFDLFKGVQEFLMPLFWFGQIVELDEPNAKKVRFALNLKMYGNILAYCLIGIGAGILLTVFIVTTTNKWKCRVRDEEGPIVEEETSEQ